jgi:hypothetical protein
LEKATEPYKGFVTNLYGPFAENIDNVLRMVQDKPVICFLDPFGIDGIDMAAIQKLMRRGGITDFWIRFETGEVRRRDGWFDVQEPGAQKQFEILCRIYGIFDRNALHKLLSGSTPEDRKNNAIKLYLKRLSTGFSQIRGEGYAAAYRIGSQEGDNKYHLVFATASKKGITLASNIVYGIEEVYQKQVEWYRLNSTGQLSMFSIIDPTEDEIFEMKVNTIQNQIWAECRGKNLSRLDIHTLLLPGWFGVIKGSHLTRALQNLCKGKGVISNGQISQDSTIFTFP